MNYVHVFYIGVCVCDVALLKPHQKKKWCMLWLIYFWLCFTANGAALSFKLSLFQRKCSTSKRRAIEVDIFNTFDIYWCMELNSDSLFTFRMWWFFCVPIDFPPSFQRVVHFVTEGKIINIGNIEILMRCTAPDRARDERTRKNHHL